MFTSKNYSCIQGDTEIIGQNFGLGRAYNNEKVLISIDPKMYPSGIIIHSYY